MKQLIDKHPVAMAALWFGVLMIAYIVMAVIANLFGNSLYASALFDAFMIGFSLYVMKHIGKGPFAEQVKFQQFAVGYVLLILMWVSTSIMVVWASKTFTDPFYQEYEAALNGNRQANEWLTVFLALIAAPVAEEFFYRKVLYGTLRHMRCPMIYPALISSALFALSHGTIMHIFPATIMGVGSCLVYEWTGNIWWSVLLHISYNLFSLSQIAVVLPDWAVSTPVCLILTLLWSIGYGLMYLELERRASLKLNSLYFK